MLTIRTVQNIRRGAWITLYNGIYAIILGIFYLISMRFMLKENFSTKDLIWQIFEKYNPVLSHMFFKLIILKAVLVIALGIAIIYLSNYILRKKEKSAWIVLFIIGLIFWPALLTMDVLDRNIYTMVLSFIGWLSFLIGMIIPIRYYLERDYSEY